MADGAMDTGLSAKEPQCYNCGVHGHLTFACPEPTRAVPAGLEAHRKRLALQEANGIHSRGNGFASSQKRYHGMAVTVYPPAQDTGGPHHPSSQQRPYHPPPPPLLPPPPPPPPPSDPASAPDPFQPPPPTSHYPSHFQPRTSQDSWAHPQPPDPSYAAVSYPPPAHQSFQSYASYGRPIPPDGPYYNQAFQPPLEYSQAPAADGAQPYLAQHLLPQPPLQRWPQNGPTGSYPAPGVSLPAAPSYPYSQGVGNIQNNGPWSQGKRGDSSFSGHQKSSNYNNNRRGRGGPFNGGFSASNRGSRGDHVPNLSLQRGISDSSSSLTTPSGSTEASSITAGSHSEESKDGNETISNNGNSASVSIKSSNSVVANIPKPPGLPAKPPTPISMLGMRHRQQQQPAVALGNRPPPWSGASTPDRASPQGHRSPLKPAGRFPYNGADESHLNSPKRGRDDYFTHTGSDRDGKRSRPSPAAYSVPGNSGPHSEPESSKASPAASPVAASAASNSSDGPQHYHGPARKELSPHARPHTTTLPGGVPASLPLNPTLAHRLSSQALGHDRQPAEHERRSDHDAGEPWVKTQNDSAKHSTSSAQRSSISLRKSPVLAPYAARAPPKGSTSSRGRNGQSRSRSRSRGRSDSESPTGSPVRSRHRGRYRSRSQTVSRSSSRSRNRNHSHSPSPSPSRSRSQMRDASKRPAPRNGAASTRRKGTKSARSRSSSPLDDLELAMLGMVRPEDGASGEKDSNVSKRRASNDKDNGSRPKPMSPKERIKKRPPRAAGAYSRRW